MRKLYKWIILVVLFCCLSVGIYGMSRVLIKHTDDSRDVFPEEPTKQRIKDKMENSQIADSRVSTPVVDSDNIFENESPAVDNDNIFENESPAVDNNNIFENESPANFISYGSHMMEFDANKYDVSNKFAYGIPKAVYDISLDENGMHECIGDLYELLPIIKNVRANKGKYFGSLDKDYEKKISVEEFNELNWASSGDTEYMSTSDMDSYDYIRFDDYNASAYAFFDNYYVMYITNVDDFQGNVVVFVDYSKRAFTIDSCYIDDYGIVEGGFDLFLNNCNVEDVDGWRCYFMVDGGPFYRDRNYNEYTFEQIARGDKIDW